MATRTSVCVSLAFLIRRHANIGLSAEYADANPVGQATIPLMDRGGKGKFSQWIGNVRQPLEQRIQNKQNGIGRQSRPYVGG